MAFKPLALLLLILSLSFTASFVSAHGGGSDDDDDAVSSSPPPNLRAKSLILVKVWCLIIVFFATFVAGVSPYFLKWNETFLVLGTQFAGGIFLATAMIHFLSDSNETFGDLTDLEYPFAFMLACAGYVITMLADCVIAMVVEKKRGVRDVERNGGNLELQSKQIVDNGATQQQPEAVNCAPHESTAAMLRDANSLGDSILLIVALCFHSVFEGIAIGVAENKADAWKALWTISLHKIFAAIAMGIALLRMMPYRPLLSTVSYSFAFAISSPIGVAIGIVIDATTQGRVADWIYAISMGLACGIFVYVAINHLLAKGYKPRQPVAADRPFVRWLAVVFGVAVLAVVMIWDT